MTLEEKCILSYYQKVADIDEKKHVYLVQHVENRHFYVQKELTIYKKDIYDRLKQLNSSYFPRIYEAIESTTEDDKPCLLVIEEYIQGEDYKEILEKEGVLPEQEALVTGIWLCQALSTLHHLNPPIIHRDVKPSNLIRQRGGQLCLIDFNTAKEYEPGKTKDTIAMGTVDFAAPEQFGYIQSDVRTDIYGIAAFLNYLLTGKAVKEQLYPTSQTPDDFQTMLGKIIEKGTAFNPADRYQSAEEMKMDLERCRNPYAAEKPSASRRRFCPPGFRTRKITHMISAALGYVFILWFGLTMEFTSENQQPLAKPALWTYRICFTAMMLHLIFFIWNYMGLRTKSPFMKRLKNKYLRLLLSILYSGFIVLIWLIIMVLLVYMLFEQ